MTARDIFSPLNIILGLALAAAAVAGLMLVPAGMDLPIHWGITGEADRYLPREAALLLMPGIAMATIAVLLFAQRLAGEERRRAARHAIGATVSALLALFLAIEIATVMIGTGLEVDMVRVVVLDVGLVFVVIGNIMPKTQPNWVAGIRLPSTLADAGNWQATHRLAGVLLMLGGAAIALAALLTGNPVVLLALTFAGILLPLVIASIYSFWRARNARSA